LFELYFGLQYLIFNEPPLKFVCASEGGQVVGKGEVSTVKGVIYLMQLIVCVLFFKVTLK